MCHTAIIMIRKKSPQEIESLRKGGKLLAQLLRELKAITIDGVSSDQLEYFARDFMKKHNVTPAFMGYSPAGASRPFPAALCLSVNDAVVHGIPHEKPFIIKNGDLVVLDTGLSYEGMIVDAAITVAVGEVDTKASKLLEAGNVCLEAAMEVCVNWPKYYPKGIRSGDVGVHIEKALEFYHSTYGFSFAENMGGHGVGHSVHEDPFMPNFGMKGQGPILTPGTVVAIEPIVNEKSPRIRLDKDGYTIRTVDGKRSVHVEHTVVFTETGAEILTQE
jgi:methionyl aminopeptidase